MSNKVNVKTVVDSKRGCGWRKPGGMYLRCDGVHMACGKLPIPLSVCPCCHAGIKPARGWTWIDIRPFVEKIPCGLEQAYDTGAVSVRQCGGCVVAKPPERVGLLWIGEKFYPRPSDWLEESNKLGVSRRISRVPKDFVTGETWVFVAHRKCIRDFTGKTDPDCPLCQGKGTTTAHGSPCSCRGVDTPGIFHVFRPDRIEYVTTGKETQEELADLVKRGLTPVKVQRDEDLPEREAPPEK